MNATHCPHCGHTKFHTIGGMGVCAKCHRWWAPEDPPEIVAALQWGRDVRQKLHAQRGDVWVTLDWGRDEQVAVDSTEKG